MTSESLSGLIQAGVAIINLIQDIRAAKEDNKLAELKAWTFVLALEEMVKIVQEFVQTTPLLTYTLHQMQSTYKADKYATKLEAFKAYLAHRTDPRQPPAQPSVTAPAQPNIPLLAPPNLQAQEPNQLILAQQALSLPQFHELEVPP